MAVADVDIYVGNTIIVDPDVYHLWLNGYTTQEAAQIQQKRGVLQRFSATHDMLLSDTKDHFRTFSMIEPLLKSPLKMAVQQTFQIPSDTQKMLIEKYYEFDQSVVREFLGKKLTTKMRGSIEDMSEKTRVPQRSCRRQFDNVKQVFKVVEEMPGSLVQNIKSHFLLPDYLAQQYAAVVFMSNHKFETSKKKLQYLNFHDFAHCTNEMIQNWSYSSKDCVGHEDMDVDLDREFLLNLRELKILQEKEVMEEHKLLTCRQIHSKVSTTCHNDVENNFRNYTKTLINIAYGLNHVKQLKDFFVDLVEKFIEPCRNVGWSVNDVRLFLVTYKQCAQQMDLLTKTHPSLLKIFERYMTTLTACVIRMYHS